MVAAVRSAHAAEARNLGASAVAVLGGPDWTGAPSDHVFDTVGGPEVGALCRHLAPGLPLPIAHRLRLEDAIKAHRLLEAGGLGGKIILEL